MTRIPIKKELNIYVTREGKRPFIDWLESLKDKTARYRIKERLDRVALGNMGDHKSVGNGVMEIRFKFGSGYRISYGEEGGKIILLLCGGDKSSQAKDIKRAHLFWEDYLER
ncbi:MAG TPA: type II toxin-antitoxin system RelE/ParE family toxin [Gammaproteobacteria bacterium]|nr:type II toxin-antitoxin system RelE/ParE family toxin [Gammaproteobacteria bacterium]